MVFLKEDLINNIINLNDFETIKYITNEYFVLSMIVFVFILPNLIGIIMYKSMIRPKYFQIMAITEALRFIIIMLILLGFLPYYLS